MNKKTFSLGVFLVLIVLIALGNLNLFGVGNVKITGDVEGCLSREQITKELNLTGQNIFFLDEGKITRQITSTYPCVRSVKLKKVFLKNIEIEINTRMPLAVIAPYKIEDNLSLDILEATPASTAALLNWSFPQLPSNSLIVDNLGFIFKQGDKGFLPALFVENKDLKLGLNLDQKNFNDIAVIFEKLKKMEVTFTQSKMVSNWLQIQGDQKIIFSLSKDVLRQLASLQLILQESKINGRAMEIVDLRFDKPVVVFATKK